MAEAAPLPETLSFSEFARRHNWKPSYVTQLRKDGRLVLTADGRRVLAAESIARIAATRDPSKAGVRARHAAGRGQVAPEAGDPGNEVGQASAGQEPPVSAGGGDDDGDMPFNSPHQLRRAKALADKEEALARKAQREELVEMGQLLVKDEVVAAVADGVVQLRAGLELLVSTLPATLAALDDEDEVRVQMRDAFEQMLGDLSRKFAVIGRATA
ncbi:MAG: hypothetical protein LCH59_00720 [Proteobacteria bacterium]|nr:hypothetical protein [Pseudomonadota bacterium]